MKEITIQFSAEELRELAKQLYLARYFLISCHYDNEKMVDDIMNRICATGMAEAPETNGFRHGGLTEPMFFISMEVDDECQPLVEIYNSQVIKDYLPYRLADRDFQEQYGYLDSYEILNNPKLLAAIKAFQKKYIDEFERYDVTHFRLEEPK
ncbi:MAG: hypothetical protein Q8891_04825 [Bacteroidota bacterium]|nr:hypothetical protein [Bacteroidota bacterium]